MFHKKTLFTGLAAVIALVLFGIGCAPRTSVPTSTSVPVPVPMPTLAQPATVQPAVAHTATQPPTSAAKKTVILSFDADMTTGMRAKLRSGAVKAWYDPAVINLLLKTGVPARIFVTGLFAETYPDLIRELAKSPNITFGNHTYDHLSFEPHCYGLQTLTTDDAKRAEITKTQTVIKDLTGVEPTLFRYPGLCRNEHDDVLVSSLGLTIDDGNLTSGDAFNHRVHSVTSTVLNDVHDGSEILFHLGGPNAPTDAVALADLIPKLQAIGFEFGR